MASTVTEWHQSTACKNSCLYLATRQFFNNNALSFVIVTMLSPAFKNSNLENMSEIMCSTAVKVKLFTAYFNNVYMCALWVNYRKTAFQQFKVAYNNSYRILNRLPMRCSASNMFANGNVNSYACVLRKSIYSLMTRIHASLNPIVNSIVRGDVYCTSALHIQWVSQLYNM